MGVVEVNCLTTEVYVESLINGGGCCTRASLSKLIAASTTPFSTRLSNAAEPSASSKGALQRYTKSLVIALMFILWIMPAPIVNRVDLKIFGIPLLWFYYLVLSVSISLALTLLYLKSRGGE